MAQQRSRKFCSFVRLYIEWFFYIGNLTLLNIGYLLHLNRGSRVYLCPGLKIDDENYPFFQHRLVHCNLKKEYFL